MAQTISLRIGADVSCTDGGCGRVSRIIVNPLAPEVTHLAVDPRYRRGPGRLVPVDLVGAAAGTTGQVRLRCTMADFLGLQPAQKTETVPDLDPTGHKNSPPDQARWVTWRGPVPVRPRPGDAGQQVTVDSVPPGGVDVRRSLTVCATDGDIGQARGLVVEPGGHRVTHVLLERGRLLGRKEAAIPIGAVTKIGTLLIHLSLTRRQVDSLPPVDVGHPAG